MNSTFDGLATEQPNHQDVRVTESERKAKPEQLALEKLAKPTKKLVEIGELDLHPDFAEFKSAIAKVTFELKYIGQVTDTHHVKQISRREIKVVERDSKFLVVAGIRCWQIATTILAPKTRIEVTRLPAFSESDIFETLIEELIVSPIYFRPCHAGAEELVVMYGTFRRDPRFLPILQRIFTNPPTKERFAEILGLRPETVSQKQKKKSQETAVPLDIQIPDMLGKDQSHE